MMSKDNTDPEDKTVYDFGNGLVINIEGESHSKEMRVTLSGFPKGFRIDCDELCRFMKRRASGGVGTTARREPDALIFSAGVENNTTTGENIEIVIENTDVRESDYEELRDVPRPGHADYTLFAKYGKIPSGGGKASGRMTALLCAAGGIVLQYLRKKGIFIGAHAESIGGVLDLRFDSCVITPGELSAIAEKEFPVIDDMAGERMQKVVEEAAAESDSVGGVVECAVTGLPAGVGSELFGGLESKISSAVFAVPAVKGVEFGTGFAAADIKGSENNDPFVTDGERIYTETNNCGGILGGISDGMPVVFRAAVKPVPSIGKEQRSVSLSNMEERDLSVAGRHDACIVSRAVPVIEAVCALAVMGAL